MKRRTSHHKREALIMAAILPAIIGVGVVAGIVVQWLARHP